MKRRYLYLIVSLYVIFFLFTYNIANAGVFKFIRVGKYTDRVLDSGHETYVSPGDGSRGFSDFDGFRRPLFKGQGSWMGTKDWTDEDGQYWPVKLAGSACVTHDEVLSQFAIPDDEAVTIRQYWRYNPPTIVVDGVIQSDPFPLKGEEVNPSKIQGTADVMLESQMRTAMGVSIHQRVLAWSQKNHDDYIIWDWTFTNTGNIDRDDEIELPDQTLKDWYFMRQLHGTQPNRKTEWNSWYGEHLSDTMRITYTYPQRQRASSYDNQGDPRSDGYLRGPRYAGETVLHVDKSPTDNSDDPSQPQMHCIGNPDVYATRNHWGMLSPVERTYIYNMMINGFREEYGTEYMHEKYPDADIYPGTHHEVRPDERGVKFVEDFPWFYWHALTQYSHGPYTLAPGEDIRMVRAKGVGTISKEKSWELGTAWNNKMDIEPPPGCVFGVTDNLPPQYKLYPALYAADSRSSDYNNWAKDCWVMTGKDSLFNNAWAAQWNCRNDYNIPVAPPPPSVEIASRPDRIDVIWGNESESASDFAGYRVYRAIGDPYYSAEGGVIIGKWECIFETTGTGTHSYSDTDAERGQAYFYYVTAFDDGVGNIADVNGKKEVLESGKYLNMTTRGAYLTRPAGTLSTVRVVPNPFNISAKELQYVGEPDKIMFLNIPGYCTIKIYTESGDLVKTLYHTDGSGDESWGDLVIEHSTTETGQLIVSGIYIALIEENNEDGTPTGNTHFVKFVVVR